MCPRHLPPYHPYLRASDLSLPTIHVRDALAEVERCGLLVVHILDLDDGGVWVLGASWVALVSDLPSHRFRVLSYLLAALMSDVLAPVMAIC